MVLEVTWYGTSCFKLRTDTGIEIYMDPYLDSRRGFNPPPILSKDIKKADLLLATHGHFDHFQDALTILKETEAKLVASREVVRYIEEKIGIPSSRLYGVNHDEYVSFNDIEIYVTKAVHRPAIEILRWWFRNPELKVQSREEVIELFKKALIYEDTVKFAFSMPPGPLQGYLITTEDGFRIWNISETKPIDELAQYRRKFKPQIYMISALAGHEGDTLKVIDIIKPKIIILYQFDKIHSETPYYENYEELQEKLIRKINKKIEVIVPKPGEPYIFDIAWKHN
ncbi:MAG: MBL fold metallo-hydrolase [Candidatus Methanomethylicia archaeon]